MTSSSKPAPVSSHRCSGCGRPRALLLGACLLVCALGVGARRARAQSAERTGRIERITAGQYFLDLGSDDGLAADTLLEVQRGGRTIAHLRVDRLFAHRAIALLADVRIAPRVGDRVVFRLPVVASGGDALAGLERPGAAPAAVPSGTAAPPAQAHDAQLSPEEVLRRLQQAPRRPQPVSPRTGRTEPPVPVPVSPTAVPGAPPPPSGAAALPPPPPSNVVSGSVRLGYGFQRDADGVGLEQTWHSPRIGLRLSVDRIAGADLAFRFRGDARTVFASSDLADRRGRELDTRSYLYEAALEYGGSGGLVHAAIGRVGLWDLPTVGSVDGARLGLRLGPLEVGGFGGLDAALDGSDRGRTSWGGYLRFETPPGEVWSWDLSTAYERTSTDGGGKLDRELIAADTRLRWHPWLTAYGRVELDLYGNTQNLLGRSDIELTDVYGSLTLRPLDPWTIGLSFDRRLSFFGEQTLRELAPEARIALPDEVLSTARLDTRVDLPRSWWVGAAVDLRRGGDNGDRNTWTLEGGCYAISDEPAIGFDLALEAWQGDLWRGEAGRIGLSYSPLAVLDLSLRYELTLDRFEPTGLDITRHDVQADVFWRMGRRMSLSLTGGWETGDDVDRQYVSLDWVYRF